MSFRVQAERSIRWKNRNRRMDEWVVLGVVRFYVQTRLPLSISQEVHSADNWLIESQQLNNRVILQHHVAFRMEEMRPGWVAKKVLRQNIICAMRIGPISDADSGNISQIVLD